MSPRYGFGKKLHQKSLDIVESNRETYGSWIKEIETIAHHFKSIGPDQKNEIDPYWNNHFFPGLDVLITFAILAKYQPKQYVEVGSGNSTKSAYFAKRQKELTTKIISIDPTPRTVIDSMCDRVIKKPMELAMDEIEALNLSAGDVLFIDNSHCSYPNSDVTVFFMEILPNLPKGVILQVHDIFLPYDYPPEMVKRGYSEQYLLATALMHAPDKYDIIFPAYFISQDEEFKKRMSSLWKMEGLNSAEQMGSSFWIITK